MLYIGIVETTGSKPDHTMSTKKPLSALLHYHVTGATERGEAEPILGVEAVETVDGKWMILVGGLQWGENPLDASGCSSQTWETRELAIDAWMNRDTL